MRISPNPLRIAPQLLQTNLSKGQRAFNALVKRIEGSRELLAEWQAAVLSCDLKVASDYAPLLRTFRELQAEMVRVLDRSLDRKGLTAAERRVVRALICELAAHLIIDTADQTIKAIYNKYNEADVEVEEADPVDRMRDTIESLFGVELDDTAGLDSPEALLAQLEAQMEKQRLREEAEHDPRGQRKKTVKQRAHEEKIKADEAQTSLSIRAVYRKLVSALHPDREPDPEERKRKTVLMQRVNQAYARRDLLQLLELQLELEQIDAQSIAGLSEERLQHFNKILREQLLELEQEIAHLVIPLREQFDLPPRQALMPKTVMPRLLREIAALRHNIRQIQKELLVPANPAAFKIWIKVYRRELKLRAAETRDDDNFPYV